MAEAPTESMVVRCRCCNYDLTGLPRDGLCPECGDPVAASVGWRDTGRTSAIWSLVLAPLGLLALPCLQIWTLVVWGFAAFLAIGALEDLPPGPRSRATKLMAIAALILNAVLFVLALLVISALLLSS